MFKNQKGRFTKELRLKHFAGQESLKCEIWVQNRSFKLRLCRDQLPCNISLEVLNTSDLINDPVSLLLFLEVWGLDEPG